MLKKIMVALAIFVAMAGSCLADPVTNTVQFVVVGSVTLTSSDNVVLADAGTGSGMVRGTSNVFWELYAKDSGNLANGEHTLSEPLNVKSGVNWILDTPIALTTSDQLLTRPIPASTSGFTMTYTQDLTNAKYAGTYTTTVTYTAQASV